MKNSQRGVTLTLSPVSFFQYTLTSKNFGHFYFWIKPCLKIKLSKIFRARTLQASKNFLRKECWSWLLKDFLSIEITKKKEKYTWIKGLLHHRWGTLYSHHQSYFHHQSQHFFCPRWFHVLLTLAPHTFL